MPYNQKHVEVIPDKYYLLSDTEAGDGVQSAAPSGRVIAVIVTVMVLAALSIAVTLSAYVPPH